MSHKKQEKGQLIKSDREVRMPWRIAGLRKKNWSMLWTSCKPICLGMEIDLFTLILTSSVIGTSMEMPCTL